MLYIYITFFEEVHWKWKVVKILIGLCRKFLQIQLPYCHQSCRKHLLNSFLCSIKEYIWLSENAGAIFFYEKVLCEWKAEAGRLLLLQKQSGLGSNFLPQSKENRSVYEIRYSSQYTTTATEKMYTQIRRQLVNELLDLKKDKNILYHSSVLNCFSIFICYFMCVSVLACI